MTAMESLQNELEKCIRRWKVRLWLYCTVWVILGCLAAGLGYDLSMESYGNAMVKLLLGVWNVMTASSLEADLSRMKTHIEEGQEFIAKQERRKQGD